MVKTTCIISFLIAIFSFQNLDAQNIDLTVKYNETDEQYEVYARPDATNPSFFVGGGSQITLLLPTSLDNQPIVINSVNGGLWVDNSQVFEPAAAPNHDFHAIASNGGFINFITDEEILLYTFQISIPGCSKDIRLFENETDPKSDAPGMRGGDFTNYFPDLITFEDSYRNNYITDFNCCNAGDLAPTFSTNTQKNECPAITADLYTLHTGTIPVGAKLIFSTDSDPSDGLRDMIDSPIGVATTYYGYYYDKENDCFSPASEAINVSIECCLLFTVPEALLGIEDDTIPLNIMVDPSLTKGGAQLDIIETGIGFRAASAGDTPTTFTIPANATAIRITGYGGNDHTTQSGSHEEYQNSSLLIDLNTQTYAGHIFYVLGNSAQQNDNYAFSDIALGMASDSGITTGDTNGDYNAITPSVNGNILSLVERQNILDQAYLVEYLTSATSSTNFIQTLSDVMPLNDQESSFDLPTATKLIILSTQAGRGGLGSAEEDKGISRIIIDIDKGTASGTLFSQTGRGANLTASYAFANYPLNSGQPILASSATVVGDANAANSVLPNLSLSIINNILTVTQTANTAAIFTTLLNVQTYERLDVGSSAACLGGTKFAGNYIDNPTNTNNVYQLELPGSAESGMLSFAMTNIRGTNTENENTGTAQVFVDLKKQTTSGSFLVMRTTFPDLVSWTDVPFGTALIDHPNTVSNHSNINGFNDEIAGNLVFEVLHQPDGSQLFQISAKAIAGNGTTDFLNYAFTTQAQWAGRLPIRINGDLKGGTLSTGAFDPITEEWLIDPAELSSLAYIPKAHFSGDSIQLNFQYDCKDQSTFIGISRVADLLELTTIDQSGTENTLIDITTAFTIDLIDTDGSETITTLLLDSIPVGHTLSDGVNTFTANNGQQHIDITTWNTANLTYLSPQAGIFPITITVATTDEDGFSATKDSTITTGLFNLIINQDTDKDGVADSIDLDDDNDGIPDAIECMSIYATQATQTGGVTAPNNVLGIPDGQSARLAGGDILTIELNAIPKIGDTLYLHIARNNANGQMRINASQTAVGGFANTIIFGGGTIQQIDKIPYPVKIEGLRFVKFTRERGQLLVDGVSACGDTDEDGIPDYLDLDSDGDGCLDALEAGHNLEVAMDSTIHVTYGENGLADTLETSPDSGILNYRISQSNAGIFDFIDKNIKLACKLFPPMVIPGTITLPQDSSGMICMPILDEDEADVFTSEICGTANGTAISSINSHTVCLSYQPNLGFNGQDSICLIVCDLVGNCDTVNIPVTVIAPLPPNPNPVAPVLIPSPIIVSQDSLATVCMPIIDPNEGDTFTTVLCDDSPNNGKAAVSILGNQLCLDYQPNPAYNGSDEVCIIVCDQTGLCDTAIIPILVIPTNIPTDSTQAPIVIIPTIITTEGTNKMVCGNIIDPNSTDTHTFSICEAPKNGLANITLDNSRQEICIDYTPTPLFSGNDSFCLIVCDQTGLCDTVLVPILVLPRATELQLKVFLQGALISATNPSSANEDGLMRDDLRRNGFLPMTQPYVDTINTFNRFTAVASQPETTNLAVLNANSGTPDAIVDWVFIEIRSAEDTNIIRTLSGLLQRDGDVVAAHDGGPLYINGLPKEFLIAIKHRNHLGAMTATPLSMENNIIKVDFTNLPLVDYFTSPGFDSLAVTTIAGKRALWAGNANASCQVKYDGSNNDRLSVLRNVIFFPDNEGQILNFSNAKGYFSGDINMDGTVKYDGIRNDRFINQFIIFFYPKNETKLNNFNNMLEQLPK